MIVILTTRARNGIKAKYVIPQAIDQRPVHSPLRGQVKEVDSKGDEIAVRFFHMITILERVSEDECIVQAIEQGDDIARVDARDGEQHEDERYGGGR